MELSYDKYGVTIDGDGYRDYIEGNIKESKKLVYFGNYILQNLNNLKKEKLKIRVSKNTKDNKKYADDIYYVNREGYRIGDTNIFITKMKYESDKPSVYWILTDFKSGLSITQNGSKSRKDAVLHGMKKLLLYYSIYDIVLKSEKYCVINK